MMKYVVIVAFTGGLLEGTFDRESMATSMFDAYSILNGPLEARYVQMFVRHGDGDTTMVNEWCAAVAERAGGGA